jgi:putative cell wall-binding protein
MPTTELQKVTELLTKAQEHIENYNIKRTKAESARIRKTLGEIKKSVTAVRAELLENDRSKWISLEL